jgi:hypothetical protein
MFKLYARRDRSVYRVFRSDWFGDQFEVMELTDFDKFQGYLKQIGLEIEVLEGDDEPI